MIDTLLSIMLLGLLGALAAGSAALVAAPLRRATPRGGGLGANPVPTVEPGDSGSPPRFDETQAIHLPPGPQEEKEAALLALDELERDYLAGKLSDRDYRHQRWLLMREAVGALRAEDTQQHAIEALIEQEVAAARRRPPSTAAAGQAEGRHAGRRWLIAGVAAGVLCIAIAAWATLRAPSRQVPVPVATLPVATVRGLAAGAGSPPRLVAASPGGLVASPDGGRTWQVLSLPGVSEGTAISAVAVVPATAGQPDLLIVAGKGLLQRTRDGGRTWETPAAEGLDGELRLLAAAPPCQDCPATLFGYAPPAGLVRSEDGGASWIRAGGSPPPDTTALAVAPPLAAGGSTPAIFAGTSREGVLASADGGVQWASANGAVNGALPTTHITSLAYSAGSGDRAAGGAGATFAGALYAGTDQGLFRSLDGGVTWQRLPLARPVAAVSVSPQNPSLVVVIDDQGRVYRSFDRGFSWPGS